MSRRSTRCTPVADAADVLRLVEAARGIYVEESLGRYVVALLRQTRGDQRLYLGASPRAGIALLRVAKARALSEGRDYVTPDDVKAVAVPVLAHRLILAPEARSAGLGAGGARRGRARAHPGSGLMTRAGSSACSAVGVFCWIVAVVFGSRALYPVAAGLVLAVPLAVAWVRITLRQPHVSRRWRQEDAVWRKEDLLERDDVWIQIELEREPGMPLPSVVAHERVGRLGEREVELRPHGRGATGAPTASTTCRADATASSRSASSIADPFGLAEATLTRRRASRRSSSTRAWSSSSGSSSTAAPAPSTAGGSCCGGRSASTSTASATTSRASRCGASTGRRRRDAAR